MMTQIKTRKLSQKIRRFFPIRLQQKRYTTLLYGAVAITAICWIGYGVMHFWSSNLRNDAAANHAVLVDLNKRLHGLPSLDKLQVGATAGNADEILYKYQETSKFIKELPLVNSSFFSHGFSTSKFLRSNKDTQSELAKIGTELNETTETLTTAKKFLQYDPKSDMAPIVSGQETDASERVQRTTAGLASTSDKLSKFHRPNASAIADIIKPLTIQAQSLTAANAPIWYTTVASAQQRTVTVLNDTSAPQVTAAERNINTLCAAYLSLKP